ncbi:hypothetical protein SAMN02745166_00210 [Prosthecobacter debontii]|uniref:Uncharacterized protein n=1 Tax=Prosthecobacter debontii TaxID=48467 RepID=A0A1T4WHG4_9BACT|nr:hypothetical protein [Prosthecobacter debontii]SKA76609.1 hypothetical protein SAMN02745166_00210 [Prosthecobacter debontii]
MNLELIAAMTLSREDLFPFKVLAFICVAGTLALGYYFWKHQVRLFGFDDEIPSDTSGGRDYGRMQTWVLWWGMLCVFAFFAFAL